MENIENIIYTLVHTEITSFIGIGFVAILIIFFGILVQYFQKSYLTLSFDVLYEKVYVFYEDILGKDSAQWIKTYVVILFFVIFFANISGVLLEIIAPMFGISPEGNFYLHNYITAPSANLNFNLAIAGISMLVLLYIQFSTAGVKGFLYDYFPIFGKWYMTVERKKMKAYVYYPLAVFAKIFDIVVSLFLGFLNIVGLFAKVISLSFRLFGNMTSWTVLLGTLVVAMSTMSQELTMFLGWWKLPIVLPVIVYLQEILVACIQAMVFPLLVAIFIKSVQPLPEQTL